MRAMSTVQTIHLAGAAAVIVLSLAAWTLIGMPMANSAQASGDVRKRSFTLASETADLASKTSDIHRRIAALTKDAQEAAAVLRPEQSQNERLADFSRLAASYGLNVRDMIQEPMKREAKVVRVGFVCKGTGTYTACATFLQALREQLPDFAVRSLELRGNAEQTSPTGEFHFDVVWFGRPSEHETTVTQPSEQPAQPSPSSPRPMPPT